MNALEKIIQEIIVRRGPITLADYMELALQHPEYGYYRVRTPVGRTGDFITAPEISQMFGEMIGVWCAETWRSMGRPAPFALTELGPGRGTMMEDALRATLNVKGFHDAQQLFLIDTDRPLKAEQMNIIRSADPKHIEAIAQLPKIPAIILANEFFDALPVRQFEKTFEGWTEKMVAVVGDKLALSSRELHPAELSLIPEGQDDALPGTVIEFSPKSLMTMRELVNHILTYGGALLMVDYGYVAPSYRATVQAVSAHARADIFDRPGEVDITAHVDFSSISSLARGMGATVSPIIGQGEFLRNLGIKIRADGLKRKASLPQAAEIDAALHRLIDVDQMGQSFKVLSVSASAPGG